MLKNGMLRRFLADIITRAEDVISGVSIIENKCSPILIKWMPENGNK